MRLEGYGIPLMAVTATVGAWYLIDPIYNGYDQYVREIGEETLTKAWWEIVLFLFAFWVAVPAMHRRMNHAIGEQKSVIFEMMAKREIDTLDFQDQIEKLASVVLLSWVGLMLIALVHTNYNFIGLFFPYLGDVENPWQRDRIGTGFDFLIALLTYIQIMLTALLGVIFALSIRRKPMVLAGITYLLAVPLYIFDRTRNVMIAVLLPGFLVFVTLRMRGGIVMKLMVLLAGFLMLEGWFRFVIVNRDPNTKEALSENGEFSKKSKFSKHLGFNMFEELGYINDLMQKGSYQPNWGERYFAELVNPIPRILWPGKPLIGIDYAKARGMSYGSQSAASGGVAASISTGMIGQGVVNFGPIFGPIAAALLMALWVAVLARQDFQAHQLGHLLLYAFGLVLTFNMGRDITLLVIYPFIFGWLLIYWLNKGSSYRSLEQEEN